MGCSVCETGINLPAPFDSFPGPPGPPSTLPLSTQTSSGSSTLSKKRPPPPPPGHKRTLSDPPSPLPHGPPNKGAVPWGKSSSSQGPRCPGSGRTRGSGAVGTWHAQQTEETTPMLGQGLDTRYCAASDDQETFGKIFLSPLRKLNNDKVLSVS